MVWNTPSASRSSATARSIAPPRMTYVSHDAPAQVRTIYRDAIDAAIKRCTPLHFSEGMGGAVAGRPIAIRFVDDRTIDNDSGKSRTFFRSFPRKRESSRDARAKLAPAFAGTNGKHSPT